MDVREGTGCSRAGKQVMMIRFAPTVSSLFFCVAIADLGEAASGISNVDVSMEKLQGSSAGAGDVWGVGDGGSGG